MDLETKSRLAYINDMGLEACAVRLRAAYHVTKLPTYRALAAECGVKHTVISNAVNGWTYPNRDVLSYLYRAHRIDFNFMMIGLFAQLPGDVQAALFPALELAEREWDQKQNSDRIRANAQSEPVQT